MMTKPAKVGCFVVLIIGCFFAWVIMDFFRTSQRRNLERIFSASAIELFEDFEKKSWSESDVQELENWFQYVEGYYPKGTRVDPDSDAGIELEKAREKTLRVLRERIDQLSPVKSATPQ